MVKPWKHGGENGKRLVFRTQLKDGENEVDITNKLTQMLILMYEKVQAPLLDFLTKNKLNSKYFPSAKKQETVKEMQEKPIKMFPKNQICLKMPSCTS